MEYSISDTCFKEYSLILRDMPFSHNTNYYPVRYQRADYFANSRQAPEEFMTDMIDDPPQERISRSES